MRIIKYDDIVSAVKKIVMDAAYYLGDDVKGAISNAKKTEVSDTASAILNEVLENAEIAEKEDVPMCQDTGYAVYFVEIGTDVHVDGNLEDAINEGTRQGYVDGYLRKSILKDPIKGENTKDNTPAVIWTNFVDGDKLKITIAAKGGGSENMSQVRMMKPSDGVEGVKNFVIEHVKKAGGNPCPPITVGIGIGGTFEKCAWLAKKALLRELGKKNDDTFYAELEDELLEMVNKTGVGPQGLGGRTTALGVHIETYPRHIATFPVAINIQCHASRHKSVVL